MQKEWPGLFWGSEKSSPRDADHSCDVKAKEVPRSRERGIWELVRAGLGGAGGCWVGLGCTESDFMC